MENSIRFENAQKSYGKTQVIKDLNLEIKKGERLILLGPSGCGKSTVLRMISGLEHISSGKLYLNGILANDIEPGDRSIAMVFQNYALFPHMTVEENISYGLNINKVDKKEIHTRVEEALRVLNLTGYEKRLPRELSGGQRQRVALARALVKRADFLLLDEPLSNLDAQLRGQARKELVNIHEMYNQTFVYVTHDQVEAMTIGQRIALLYEGNLQMLDTPHNVYRHPANIFAAKFIGSPSTNIIPIDYKDGGIKFSNGNGLALSPEWNRQIQKSRGKNFVLGIRPEDMRILPEGSGAPNSIKMTISYIEDYGNKVGYFFKLLDTEVIAIVPEKVFNLGDTVEWEVQYQKLHFFDADTTQTVGDPEEYI